MPTLDKSPNLTDSTVTGPLALMLKVLRELEKATDEVPNVQDRLQLGIRVTELKRVIYRTLDNDRKRTKARSVKD